MTGLPRQVLVLGLILLTLSSARQTFAQGQSWSFTFDENGHGSFAINDGLPQPLPHVTLSDPIVGGNPALFYVLPFTFIREGFVGLNEPGTPGFPSTLPSDVLHFISLQSFGAGVFVFSETELGQTFSLADNSVLLGLAASHLIEPGSILLPEVGPEGANRALYTPAVVRGSGNPPTITTDPGFIQGIAASYNFISDAPATVSGPASLLLLITGLVGIGWRRHRRN